MSDKLTKGHLARPAILYVRQSTPHQVAQNQESRRLQYAMKKRLESMGWRKVEIIDDDLGRSASGTIERLGFQRMVAEVGLGKVGAVAAREVSRFARNSRDWQKLVEVCRLVDTLLIDEETVYDPRNTNDRLLLGLKGSLNEYEIDLFRLRSLEAKRQKARRGEYFAKIPVGYVKNELGRLEKHPDRRIQHTVELIFDKILEIGSVRQLMLWLREQGLCVPRNRGRSVLWRPVTYTHLIAVLRNPTYAGAYVHGRTQVITRLVDGEIQRKVVSKPEDEWILMRDQHEGYTSWDRFERIQAMISDNATHLRAGSGAPRVGAALLAGLVRCARCGRKLMVLYSGSKTRVARYACMRGQADRGDPPCISFSGIDVDERVTAELLEVVRPAAIDAALRAAQETAQARDEVLEALQIELAAARYSAARAQRQFDAADPENRLVVDELERRWNRELEAVAELERRVQSQRRTGEARELPDPSDFAALASDLEHVWNSPGTDVKLKKRIVRTLIEEVIANVDDSGAEIVLVVHWKGGVHTELRVAKRRRGVNRDQNPVQIVEAIRLLARICDDANIARWLSRNGRRTGRGNHWSRAAVAALRSHNRIACYSPERCGAEGWVTKKQAATILGVAEKTVQRAVEAGDLEALRPLPHGPWILNVADLRRPELVARLSHLRKPGERNRGRPQPNQLSIEIPDT